MKRILTISVLYFSVISMMFAQSCPDSNHPHVIDLGIGVKFSCCNLGASAPEDYGCHYAWGELKEKPTYDELSYKYGGNNNYKRYHDIGYDISGSKYDVAQVTWGNSWFMPTEAQLLLLKNNCKSEWVTYKGVKGRKFTGPNGNSIFLPASGARWYNDTNYVGYSGTYWSSTNGPKNTNDAYGLFIDDLYIEINHSNRAGGHSIRPVTK